MGKVLSCCRGKRKREEAYGAETKLVAGSVVFSTHVLIYQQSTVNSLQDDIQETQTTQIDSSIIQHLAFLLNHLKTNRSHSVGQLDIPEARLAGDGNEVVGGWTVVVRPVSIIEGVPGSSYGGCFCIEWSCYKQMYDGRYHYQVIYYIHVSLHGDGTIITTLRFQICKTEAPRNVAVRFTQSGGQLRLPSTPLFDVGTGGEKTVLESVSARSVFLGGRSEIVLVIRKPLALMSSAGGASIATKKKRKRACKRKAKEPASCTDVDSLVDDVVSSALLNAAKAVARKEKTRVKNQKRRRRMKERIREERRQEKEAQRSGEGTKWIQSVKLDLEWSYRKPPATKCEYRRR